MLLKLSLGIFTVLVLNHVFVLVDRLGYLRHNHRHHPGTCRKVPGALHGSEDFAVTNHGDVFITSGLSWRINSPGYIAYSKRKNITGKIMLFRFGNPEKGVTSLKLKSSPSFNPTEFRPHGIDIIEDKVKGEHILFVVNHPKNLPDRIEKFQYLPETKELEHLKTYTSEKFKTLNDVAALGPDSFYTTNMCASVGRIPVMAEMLLLMKWGSVLYHRPDGEVLEAIPGLFQPNGITLSKDGRSVYVSVADVLHLYNRHDNGSLLLVQELPMQTQLDNIQEDLTSQTIYIGCQPKVHKFVDFYEHPEEEIAPSQVLAIPLNEKGLFEGNRVTELLYDHGNLISSSSVATVIDGKMLVGTVHDKLAYCEMN